VGELTKLPSWEQKGNYKRPKHDYFTFFVLLFAYFSVTFLFPHFLSYFLCYFLCLVFRLLFRLLQLSFVSYAMQSVMMTCFLRAALSRICANLFHVKHLMTSTQNYSLSKLSNSTRRGQKRCMIDKESNDNILKLIRNEYVAHNYNKFTVVRILGKDIFIAYVAL